ncbi:MAG TPA: ABC transporter permease [Bryobacteraceae bacterium]|nr:ABC transporter permease [Bryobacteraceae bacterium]
MTPLVRLKNRILFFWKRERLSRELDRELAFHQSLKQNENARAGLGETAAAEMSRRQMGNVALAREECRESWSFMGLERLMQDLKYAIRTFGRTPFFTAIAILSLALGLGGNAAMFSLVNALLIRPLPYAHPEQLMRITGTYPRAAIPFFQERCRTMDIAYAGSSLPFNLAGEGPPVQLRGSAVSPNFLPVLGANVAIGRGFQTGEDAPGRDGVMILSNALLIRRYAGDPHTVGRVIRIDGRDRKVIGVMPAGFSYPSADVELWIPARVDPTNPLEYWGPDFMPLIARLRPGATLAAARGETPRLANRFRDTFPFPMARDWNAASIPVPLRDDIVGDIRDKLVLLLASVGIVLLIACANVASLLLSRATTRRKEMALRAALGAGRVRLLRQLLTESALLALVGAAAGIALGVSILSIFKSVLPATTPGLAEAAIDWQVAGAVAALAITAGLAFGLAPAFSASQIDLGEAMKTGSQRSTSGFWMRFRKGVIIAEVALTLVLAVGAGLLLKSLYMLSATNPGFTPGRTVAVRISPEQSYCARRETCIALYDGLIDRALSISGVEAAAVANGVPLDGDLPTIPVEMQDHPKTVEHPAPVFAYSAVTADYFRMLRIPLIAGRYFTPADGPNAAGVALISASTARHYWPGVNPIGKRIKPSAWREWSTVVGVVADVRQYSLGKALPDFITGSLYLPYAQSGTLDAHPLAAMTLLVETRSDTAQLRAALRNLAESQAPNAPVGQVRRVADIVSDSTGDFRSLMRVFLSFAGTAVLLAAIGIYGLMSYWLGQRTYEIGLRVAVGASRGRVASMIFAQGLGVAAWGIVGGIAGAWALTRFLTSLLFGIAPTDVFTFVSAAVLIIAVACIALAAPACRAARIDPVKALRAD